MQPASKKRIFYGWFVFAACFLMVFTCLGFCSSPRSLYLAAITEDLGIPRSLFSMNDSCRFIATAVANFFFGFLIAKFGARKLVFGGFLCLIASMTIYSFANTVSVFCIGGTLLGLGLAWTTTTMVGYLVERWFASNKGTIMGIALAASGLGGAVSSQIVNRLIFSDAGWRFSYRITAIILVAVSVIVLLVIRNTPEEMGLSPMGQRWSTKKHKKEDHWEGISLEAAIKKPYFYISLLCIFCTGMAIQAANGIFSAHMKDCGIPNDTIANLLSMMSLILLFSKMGTGYLFDRFGLRKTFLFCILCGCIALTSLAFASTPLVAAMYSIVIPFAFPLETIMLPLIAMDLYGHHSYSKIMGLFVSFNTFGYAVGGPIMNLVFDRTGTYRSIIMVMVGILAAVGIVMQFVITAARRERTS